MEPWFWVRATMKCSQWCSGQKKHSQLCKAFRCCYLLQPLIVMMPSINTCVKKTHIPVDWTWKQILVFCYFLCVYCYSTFVIYSWITSFLLLFIWLASSSASSNQVFPRTSYTPSLLETPMVTLWWTVPLVPFALPFPLTMKPAPVWIWRSRHVLALPQPMEPHGSE